MAQIESGSVIDEKYEVIRALASGSMGDVFVARHLVTSKEVALKVLYPNVAQAIGGVERFLREVRAASAINHPGVVQIFDAGEDDGVLYYSMELLKGQSLANWLFSGEHSIELSLWLVREVLEPLAIAHKQGIVHRDIKPENIFVVEDSEGLPTVKLLDFGIAYEQHGNRMTQTGYTLGTPLYMSPEQAMAPKEIMASSDVWSIGVILYEAITGDVPFNAETPQAICILSITEPHTPVGDVVEGVPQSLANLVDRCLSKDPEERPADAQALLNALDAVLAAEDILMTSDDVRFDALNFPERVDDGALEVHARPATNRLSPLPYAPDGALSRSALQQALAATLSRDALAPASARSAMKARASVRSRQLARDRDEGIEPDSRAASDPSHRSFDLFDPQEDLHERDTGHMAALIKPSAVERVTTVAFVVVLLLVTALLTYQFYFAADGDVSSTAERDAAAPTRTTLPAQDGTMNDERGAESGRSAPAGMTQEAQRRDATRRRAQADLYTAIDIALTAPKTPVASKPILNTPDKLPPRATAKRVPSRVRTVDGSVANVQATPKDVKAPPAPSDETEPSEDTPPPPGGEEAAVTGQVAEPADESATIAAEPAPVELDEAPGGDEAPKPDSLAAAPSDGAAEKTASRAVEPASNPREVEGVAAPPVPAAEAQPTAEPDAKVDSNQEEEAPAPPITF